MLTLEKFFIIIVTLIFIFVLNAEGGISMSSEIRIKENESLESALKRFKRSCAKSGVLSELRKREHYESPSVKRRKKSEAARAKKKRY